MGKGKGRCGLTNLHGKPAAAEKKYGSAYKEENLLQKRPLPSAIVKTEFILSESNESVNDYNFIFLFSPEARVALFEKGLDCLPVILTFQAGLLALGFKV